MKKEHPDVAILRMQVDAYRKQLALLRADPGDIPIYACGHSCACARAEGMATNGPCRCDERKLRMAVQYWRGVAHHRMAVIELLKTASEEAKRDE